MVFTETGLPGAYVIDIEPRADERGLFARSWCQEEFGAQGLETRLVQCSISRSARRHTLRGVHYQPAPHAEVKIMPGTMRAIFALTSVALEIGWCGTCSRFGAGQPRVRVTRRVFRGNSPRGVEARHASRQFLRGAGVTQVITRQELDGLIPTPTTEIKEFFEQLK